MVDEAKILDVVSISRENVKSLMENAHILVLET